MGQKINPIIYRLGIKNNIEWNSKYCEKNKQEHTLHAYQNIEIYNYLKEFLSKYGLTLQYYKTYFTQKKLKIYISYYLNEDFLFLLKKKKQKSYVRIKLKNKKSNYLRNYKKRHNLFFYRTGGWIETKYTSITNFMNIKRIQKKFRVKKYQLNKMKLKLKRPLIISKYRNFNNYKKYKSYKTLNKNTFFQHLLESLSLFTNNKFNIQLILHNINQKLTCNYNVKEKKNLKKKLFLLKQYKRFDYFKEGINIILVLIKFKQSGILLGNFISKQLKKNKIHGPFLVFLKRALNQFVLSNYSRIEGIKIIINGRINNRPRSKTRIIEVGDVAAQTLKKKIDFSKTVSYTKNGTFGIKIWICYNN